MKTVSVSALRARLSAHLRVVKAGEEFMIAERGRPIARVVPFRSQEHELAELIARGVVTPSKGGPLPDSFFDLPIGKDPDGLFRKALEEDREDRF